MKCLKDKIMTHIYDTIFITGERGAGKTTLVKKVAAFFMEKYPTVKISGFTTELKETEEGNRKVVLRIAGSENEIIIGITRNNRMEPVEEGFTKVSGLLREIDIKEKFLIIDELGYLESSSENFQEEIRRLISGAKFSLVVIRKMKTPFLEEIKNLKNSLLIEIISENRKKVREEIWGVIDRFFVKNKFERQEDSRKNSLF